MEDTVYTRKFRKELMAGLSSLVLLAVLARAAREMYGYEIAKAVKAEGEGREPRHGIERGVARE